MDTFGIEIPDMTNCDFDLGLWNISSNNNSLNEFPGTNEIQPSLMETSSSGGNSNIEDFTNLTELTEELDTRSSSHVKDSDKRSSEFQNQNDVTNTRSVFGDMKDMARTRTPNEMNYGSTPSLDDINPEYQRSLSDLNVSPNENEKNGAVSPQEAMQRQMSEFNSKSAQSQQQQQQQPPDSFLRIENNNEKRKRAKETTQRVKSPKEEMISTGQLGYMEESSFNDNNMASSVRHYAPNQQFKQFTPQQTMYQPPPSFTRTSSQQNIPQHAPRLQQQPQNHTAQQVQMRQAHQANMLRQQQQQHARVMLPQVHQANPMVLSNGMAGGFLDIQQQQAAYNAYNLEMQRIQQLLMKQPELIPPPPDVINDGQRYIFLAQARAMGMNVGMGMPMAMATPQNGMPMGISPGQYVAMPPQQLSRYVPMVAQQGTPHHQMMNYQKRIPSTVGLTPNSIAKANMIPQGEIAAAGGMLNPGAPQNHCLPTEMLRPHSGRRQIFRRTQTMGDCSVEGMSVISTPNSQKKAWQSEEDLPLRRNMIARIVALLKARKPDAPEEWMRKLPDMARRLEDSLYRGARSREEYGDYNTIRTRLQQLAITMGVKAANRVGRGNGSSTPQHPQSAGNQGRKRPCVTSYRQQSLPDTQQHTHTDQYMSGPGVINSAAYSKVSDFNAQQETSGDGQHLDEQKIGLRYGQMSSNMQTRPPSTSQQSRSVPPTSAGASNGHQFTQDACRQANSADELQASKNEMEMKKSMSADFGLQQMKGSPMSSHDGMGMGSVVSSEMGDMIALDMGNTFPTELDQSSLSCNFISDGISDSLGQQKEKNYGFRDVKDDNDIERPNKRSRQSFPSAETLKAEDGSKVFFETAESLSAERLHDTAVNDGVDMYLNNFDKEGTLNSESLLSAEVSIALSGADEQQLKDTPTTTETCARHQTPCVSSGAKS